MRVRKRLCIPSVLLPPRGGFTRLRGYSTGYTSMVGGNTLVRELYHWPSDSTITLSSTERGALFDRIPHSVDTTFALSREAPPPHSHFVPKTQSAVRTGLGDY